MNKQAKIESLFNEYLQKVAEVKVDKTATIAKLKEVLSKKRKGCGK
jgi:hypothetical protein